jgi:hypothetical protein
MTLKRKQKTKNKKQKKTGMSYNLKNYRKYQGGGSMYSPNTVSSAGLGNTTHILQQESDPNLQLAREAKVLELQKQSEQNAVTTASEMNAIEEQGKQDVELAALEQSKGEQIANVGSTAISTANDLGMFKGLQQRTQDRLAAKELANPTTQTPVEKATEGMGPIGAYKTIRHAQKLQKTADSYNTTINTFRDSKAAFDASRALNTGASTFKNAQTLADIGSRSSDIGSTLNTTKTSLDMFNKGKDALSLTQKGATMGSNLQNIHMGTDGLMKTSSNIQNLSKASAIGTGLKSFAGSAGGLGLIASAAGKGIEKWSDDDDAKTMNFGEGAGKAIAGAGAGMSLAATAGAIYGSSLGPVGTAVGAVGGAVYGLAKGYIARNKARAAEKKYEKEVLAKKTKYNEELGANYASIKSRISAGNLAQKSYSGYDLGTNMNYRKGGLNLAVPRYGYVN